MTVNIGQGGCFSAPQQRKKCPFGGRRERPSERLRTAAVSSLLLGELAVRQFREGGVADLEGEKKTTVTRIFKESDEGQLFQRIRAQQLDFRKQHALYQHDRLAAVTDDFAEEHVASVLQIANNARGVINDGTSGGLAGVFYRTTLVGG